MSAADRQPTGSRPSAVGRPQPTPVYRRPLPASWWLTNRNYFFYVVRELTALFIALFLLLYLYGILQLERGPEAYAAFVRLVRSPGMLLFNVVALVLAVYHTVTWFTLAPRLQKLLPAGREAPPGAVLGGSLLAWLVLSAVIGWGLLRG
jgi:fumarate reductase subunit C